MTKHVSTEERPATKGKTISWARWYDLASWLMSFGQAPAIRRDILRTSGARRGEAVLDVGCGTGTLAIAAKRKAGAEGRVTGIDAAPEMVSVAREKAWRQRADVEFRAAAIEKLPFEAETFDLALSTFMLHHLPDDVKREGLGEVHRVLKAGGRFLAVDFSGEGGGLLGHLATVFGHGHGHGQIARLTAMLAEVGFAKVERVPTRRRSLLFLKAIKA
jgi:demethylmenaquinone methyltransferase/2-methoxy-6-polyprenyl-1,4-benzoquinol methylase/phosphoethanolamine N-methyltransferase